MGEGTKIEWCDHTFNPWTGCTNVSPACDHCYAEDWAKRYGHVGWGARAMRRETVNWKGPEKWDREARQDRVRRKVFCASLADVFDNHPSIQDAWRRRLWGLVEATVNLDWLLLTKRPQNVLRYIPADWLDGLPGNVWIGTTVENQEEANRRIPHLLDVPARVRFLSCEPLLGPVSLTKIIRTERGHAYVDDALEGFRAHKCGGHTDKAYAVDWVIAGGETGHRARPSDPNDFRSLRDQCDRHGVPFFFKQWGGNTPAKVKEAGRLLDGRLHEEFPT